MNSESHLFFFTSTYIHSTVAKSRSPEKIMFKATVYCLKWHKILYFFVILWSFFKSLIKSVSKCFHRSNRT